MHAPDPTADVGVELYVRSELPPPAQERAARVYAGLEQLAREGAVTRLDRSTWPTRTPVEDPRPDVRDAYLSFESFADATGVGLAPFFQTRECFTPEYGGWTEWLVLPGICLAVYEDDRLVSVSPHTDGEETRTVQDALDVLDAPLPPAGRSAKTAD